MLTARQLVEPSSSKRKSSKPKTEKPEKASRSKDETPEEKEARREERRIKKHEREAKKAAEMTALLGIPKMKRHRVEKEKDKHRKKEKMVEKEATTSESDSDSDSNSEEDKGKDKEILVVETPVKEPKKERKLKSTMADQFVGGLMARKPTMTVKRTGSAKREVGPTPHLSRYIHIGDNSLNIVEDSSAEPPKIRSEHRHHHQHEHSSPESELSCGHCMRRARRRAERAVEQAGMQELAERREREATKGVTLAEFRKTKEFLQRQKMEIAAARIDSRRSKPLTRPELSSRHAQHPDLTKDPEIIRQGMRNRQRERDMETLRAIGQVEIITARGVTTREESPARQAETRPQRQGAVPERPTASQVEIIPARQTNRAYVRQAEMRAQRHEERPQPQPPPHPVERPGRAVEIAITTTGGLRPRGRSQPGRSSAAIQPERPTAARRQSISVRPTEREPPQLQPQPQPQPTRLILGFELEDKPEKLIECVSCMDDEVPSKEAAKLACGHWFCNECLRRLFLLSMTDPAHMPPKCCTSDHIPLKHAQNLLWHQEKKTWNRKYLEYTTANRLYCPTVDCGEWIQPKDIQNNVGQCQKCRTKVCATCNKPAHGDGDCPSDPDTLKFIETAKKHKYQRCYSCRAMVELERGCNHMTCHCTAQFCYVCGSKWKSCDCPWFNYEPGEAERVLMHPPGLVHPRGGLRAHRVRLHLEEEVARRLGRAAGVVAPGDANEEDLARQPAPQIDPPGGLRALAIGLGVRNGIRRLAADYIETARAERPAPPIRRQTEPVPPAAGPGLARVNGAAGFHGAAIRPAPAQVAPVVLQVSPPPVRNQSVHAPGVPLAAPRSNFLTASQQANVERFIAAVDLDDPKPAVNSPFHQLALGENDAASSSVVAVAGRPVLRRSNTDRPSRQVEYIHRSRANAGENGGRRTSDVTGAGLGLAGLRAALEMSGNEGRRR